MTAKVQSARSLASLKQALRTLNFKLGNREMETVHEEKSQMDNRIENKRYAFVAQRKDHYQRVGSEIDDLNAVIEKEVHNAERFADELIRMDYSKSGAH